MAALRDQASLKQSLNKSGFSAEQANQIADLSKPAVIFNATPTSDDDIAIGASKLSGLPDLAGDQSWPIRPAYENADDKQAYIDTELERYENGTYSFLPDFLIPFQMEYNQLSRELVAKPFPLFFVAQLNFADAAAVNPDIASYIPREGVLSFFFDLIEQPWGFDPADRAGFKVLWSEPEDGPLKRTALPAELITYLDQNAAIRKAERDAAIRAREAQQNRGFLGRLLHGDEHEIFVPEDEKLVVAPLLMTPRAQVTLPDFYQGIEQKSPNIAALHAEGDETDLLLERWYYETPSLTTHSPQIGGHPSSVQDPDMRLQAHLASNGLYLGDSSGYQSPEAKKLAPGATDWVFLAQISSIDEGWMWADDGVVYIWIRRQDLAARNFDKAWVILQSY